MSQNNRRYTNTIRKFLGSCENSLRSFAFGCFCVCLRTITGSYVFEMRKYCMISQKGDIQHLLNVNHKIPAFCVKKLQLVWLTAVQCFGSGFRGLLDPDPGA